jgi:hypothetical protein
MVIGYFYLLNTEFLEKVYNNAPPDFTLVTLKEFWKIAVEDAITPLVC